MNKEIMWYYQFEGKRAGPITQSKLLELINDGIIQRDTLVWKEGMPDWQEAYLTDLNTCFSAEPINSFSNSKENNGFKEYLTSKVDLPQKLRSWYLIFGISLSVSIFLATLGPLAMFSAIISTFFGLLIMYHVWNVIPADKRMFSPFIIIILMIIPVFNLIWIFYCYYVGAKKINEELILKGISDYKVNEYYALGYSILALVMTILFIVAFFTNIVFAPIVMVSMVIIVFLQIFMIRSFIIGIVKLL